MVNITLERWEADELIICIDGKPVGGTVGKTIGPIILDWLKIAHSEIIRR